MNESRPLDCAQEETVHRLYRQFGKAALSKLLRMLGRRELAQEVVQEVFIRLWQKAPTFPSDKAAYVWIYKTCHNAAIDAIRSRAHREQGWISDCEEQPEFAACDSPLKSADLRQQLIQAIEKLSDQDAKILMYTALDGMGQEEVAAHLDVSRKTVQRSLARSAEILNTTKEVDA